jgi:hypothetical protein
MMTPDRDTRKRHIVPGDETGSGDFQVVIASQLRHESAEMVSRIGQYETSFCFGPCLDGPRGAKMSAGDWEDLREEVCTYLAVGSENGESELETMTRLVWLERQKSFNLYAALEAIERVVSDVLEPERRAAGENSNVLEWKTGGTRPL